MIRSKQAEQNHKKLLNKSDHQHSRQNIVAPYHSRLNHNIVQMTMNWQLAQLNKNYLHCCIISGMVQKLGYCGSQGIPFENVHYEPSHSEQLVPGPCENQLMCLWLVTHKIHGYQRNAVQRVNIECLQKKQDGQTVFQLRSAGYQSLHPHHISSICYIGASPEELNRILYVSTTVRDQMNDIMSYAIIDSVDRDYLETTSMDDIALRPTRFQVGRLWTWACAANSNGSSIVVGTEKKSVLFDVETGCRYSLDTVKSDVMSEAFANNVSKNLYC